jgi:hypothetical protein
MSEGFQEAGGIVVSGADSVMAASRIALRGALRMEVRGMKRRGRSARVIANEAMGLAGKKEIKTAAKAYPVYDAWLAERYGVESWPL